MISNRCRQRGPNLTSIDRIALGLTTLFVSPPRIPKLGAVIKPATLLRFHKALVNRKYSLLFSSSTPRRKPGPKGPSVELIAAILWSHWVMLVMDVFTRRLIGFGVERADIDGTSVYRMFYDAVAGQSLPKHVSTDHDPLFRFHRWLATLRVLEIEGVKSIPYVPVSHPFVERLIGTIRREYLDRMHFWNVPDLTRKLADFRGYYNADRVHRALGGTTPAQCAGAAPRASAALSRR